MSRLTLRLGNEMGLAEIERSYLTESHWLSAGIPKRSRKQFATELAEQLSERPPAVSRVELEDALGAPSSVVRAFNDEHGLNSPMAPWSRWWAIPRWLRLIHGGLVVAVAVAGVVGYQYFTATPVFWNYCGGVAASDVQSFEAAGATEYRAAFRQDERLGLYVCIGSSTPGAVVERIRAPLGPQSAIQPVGVENDLDASDSELFVGNASRNGSFEPYEEPSAQSVLWYEMEYCNLVDGGAIGFESFFIDYRYRGRSRSMRIPLEYRASVDASGQCTDDVRAQIEVEGGAWARAVASAIRDFGDLDGAGPMGLYPESVSRDLCRYLDGVVPYRDGRGEDSNAEFEPLEERAVFQLEDTELAELLIDGAVLGICPNHADRRDELVEILS